MGTTQKASGFILQKMGYANQSDVSIALKNPGCALMKPLIKTEHAGVCILYPAHVVNHMGPNLYVKFPDRPEEKNRIYRISQDWLVGLSMPSDSKTSQ